jgi:hypothetical protein
MNKNFVKICFFSVLVIGFGQPGRGSVLDSLTMLGHATVKIKTSQGMIIYIDPFQPGNYSDSADCILISHQHNDHNRSNMVRQRPTCTVISNFEAHPDSTYRSFTIGAIHVEAVPAYNANHQRNACVGYVIEFNGIKLYHAGDTGNIIEMSELAARDITYALLPMDGIFTMSPEQATQAAAAIDAAYYIPIHTMPPPDTLNLSIVARFTVPNKIVVRNGESIALQSITSVEETPTSPPEFQLAQNYPNPFNPTTRIRFVVGAHGYTSLRVFDVLGRVVATIVDEVKAPGEYSVTFSAESGSASGKDGSNLGSGVYFYRLRSGEFIETRKLILMK